MTAPAAVPTITLIDDPDPGMKQAIVRPLVRLNEARSGRQENHCPLAVLLRDPVTGDAVGGLWGATHFDQLFIELLFVPEAARGGGLGREVMCRAETEAVRRGCRGAWLDTFSFQARGFYERLGYAVFGTIEEYPPGHRRFFLKKALAPPAVTAIHDMGKEAFLLDLRAVPSGL